MCDLEIQLIKLFSGEASPSQRSRDAFPKSVEKKLDFSDGEPGPSSDVDDGEVEL